MVTKKCICRQHQTGFCWINFKDIPDRICQYCYRYENQSNKNHNHIVSHFARMRINDSSSKWQTYHAKMCQYYNLTAEHAVCLSILSIDNNIRSNVITYKIQILQRFFHLAHWGRMYIFNSRDPKLHKQMAGIICL